MTPSRHTSIDTPVSDAEMRAIQGDVDELAGVYDVVFVGVVYRASDTKAFNGTPMLTSNLCPEHLCTPTNMVAAIELIAGECNRRLLEMDGAAELRLPPTLHGRLTKLAERCGLAVEDLLLKMAKEWRPA